MNGDWNQARLEINPIRKLHESPAGNTVNNLFTGRLPPRLPRVCQSTIQHPEVLWSQHSRTKTVDIKKEYVPKGENHYILKSFIL